MHRTNGRTKIQEAVIQSDTIDDIDNITKLVVNKGGLRRIKSK